MTIHCPQIHQKRATPKYSFSDWLSGRNWPAEFDGAQAQRNGWTDDQIHKFYRAPSSTGARSEDDDGTILTWRDVVAFDAQAHAWRFAPYGWYSEPGGSYVPFDRDYHPIARKKPDGSVEIVPPDAWIDFEDQHWFYGARGTLPSDNRDVADRIRGVIARLGIRDEIIRRMRLGKLPRATPPRDGYGGRARP